VGAATWFISLFQINISHVNGLGFAGAFTPLTWIGLVLIVIGLAVVILRVPSESKHFWTLNVVGLVATLLVIHGTPMILESAPRFFEAYQHLGFIEYIYRTHQHSTNVNYRLGWYGAFGMAATLSGTAGPPALLGAIRWTPLVFDTLVLIPVHSIARKFVPTARHRALVLFLFIVGNWIGQDYLSPQAMAYFLSMSTLALLLHLAPAEGTTILKWREWFREKRVQPAVVIVAGIIAVGIVLAHQISPIMLLALTLVLALSGIIATRYFPVFVFVATLTWLSAGATSFWSGNIDRLFGVNQQAGQKVSISNIIRQNLIDRLHQFGLAQVVAFGRFGLALVLIALTAIAAWRMWKQISMRVVTLLATVPFVVMFATGYGGEALLRAYFFSLPFQAILIANHFLERPIRPRRAVVWAVVFVILAAFTEIDRYGNEQFERISANQVTAMSWLYHHVPNGTTMLAFGSAMPINFVNYGEYITYQMDYFEVKYFGPGSTRADQVRSILKQTSALNPQIVIWTPEAALFDVHVRHYKLGWDRPVLSYLENEPDSTMILNRPDIKIISLDPALHLHPPKDILHAD
jgi:hypothetical protein